ncbi:Uncharacterised protein [Mycobacteroides abscessus subsp. abscessus]|nr:Uncharacterised protein [Mycobacteroides abscessus subsp. abscessus]
MTIVITDRYTSRSITMMTPKVTSSISSMLSLATISWSAEVVAGPVT